MDKIVTFAVWAFVPLLVIAIGVAMTIGFGAIAHVAFGLSKDSALLLGKVVTFAIGCGCAGVLLRGAR